MITEINDNEQITNGTLFLLRKLLKEIRQLTPKEQVVKIHGMKKQEEILDRLLIDKDKLIKNLKIQKEHLELKEAILKEDSEEE